MQPRDTQAETPESPRAGTGLPRSDSGRHPRLPRLAPARQCPPAMARHPTRWAAATALPGYGGRAGSATAATGCKWASTSTLAASAARGTGDVRSPSTPISKTFKSSGGSQRPCSSGASQGRGWQF